MDIWRSLVSIFLLSWILTHMGPGPWFCVAETCKPWKMEIAQQFWWALPLLCPPAETCFLNVQTETPNHILWSLPFLQYLALTRIWVSMFVAAHQAILVTSVSLSLPSTKAEHVQLPQPLLVSRELPVSCHFGSTPLDLLHFLPIPLQLEAQTRHTVTDGISPPNALFIADHRLDIKPLITSLWRVSIKLFFWTAQGSYETLPLSHLSPPTLVGEGFRTESINPWSALS